MFKSSVLIPILLSLTLLASAQEASPQHAVGADFNGDGLTDIAVGSSNGRIFLMLGESGAPTGAPKTYLVPGQPDDLTIADFTGDGLPDLLCNTGTSVAILYGDKEKGLLQPLVLEPGFGQITDLSAGDFNNDGKPDLAVATWSPDTLTLLLGEGEGLFSAPISSDLPLQPFSIAAVDLDEDGSDEAAVSLVGNKKVVHAKLVDGKLDTSGRLRFDGPIGYLTAGDFDGDGKDDLGAVGNNMFWLVLRKRGKIAPPEGYSAGPNALLQFADAGDLDGDGCDELISTDLSRGTVVVRCGKPVDDGVFAWRASAVDLDGDGKAEILVANVRHGTIGIIRHALEEPSKSVYNVDPNRD
ncbi:MAG: VCBS repeat-containing protein [Candidatus Eremiobacteraeota bacterium]|nr:VCBS repeat-containing protein [Candidatus Eremiobacteraeota bacterium]